MSGRHLRSESLREWNEDTMPPAEISGKIPWRDKDHHSSFRGGRSTKWSNIDGNDAVISDDFSGRPSWEPLQGNENMWKDDNLIRDKSRMQTDPAFDKWDNQYNIHPSDDRYSLPYRARDRDRRIGGRRSMCRDGDRSRSRSRSWSPNRSRSRSRSRGRGSARGLARSRSRSRSRDMDRDRAWGSASAGSRSPFGDERRESYEYTNVRNDSRVSSRLCKDFAVGNCRKGSQCRFLHQEILNSRAGWNRLDNDLTEWSSRSDYSAGSRYGDNRYSADRSRRGFDGYRKDSGLDEEVRSTPKDAYLCKGFIRGRCHWGASCRFPHHVASGDDHHKGERNVYDDQDHKRQSNRIGRVPCKFFAAGKCNRDDCKFSHDAPESGYYDRRSLDNSRGRNLHDRNRTWNDQQPHDDLNASDFSKSNRNFDDNKSWNGPTLAEVESNDFDERARKGHPLDNKKKAWDGPTWDDVESGGFDERSCNYIQGRTLDDKNRTWDGQLPKEPSGFSDVANCRHNSDHQKSSWGGPPWEKVNAPGLSDDGKSNHNLDNEKKSRNDSTWNDVESGGFDERSRANLQGSTLSDKNRTWNGPLPRDASGFSDVVKSKHNSDDKKKPWNGPTWDDVESGGFDKRACNNVQGHALDDKNRTWDDRSPQNALGFSDVGKSKHDSDDKKRSWGGVNAAGFSDAGKSNHNSDNKKKSWNGPTWDDVESGGFDDRSRDDIQGRPSGGKSRTCEGPFTQDASGSSDVAKFMQSSEDKKKPWNDPTWNNVESGGFDGSSRDNVQGHTLDAKNKTWDGSLPWDTSCFSDVARSKHNSGDMKKSGDGPSWDEVVVPGASSVQQHQRQGEDNPVIVIDDSDVSNADMVSEDANQQSPTSVKDAMTVQSMGSQTLSSLNETEQSSHILSLSQLNGPKIQLNEPVQGMFVHLDSYKQTQMQNKEGHAISEPVPQASGLPAPFVEVSQKVQLPQAYTDLNISNPLDLLCSRYTSYAPQNNLDTRSEEQYEPARNMEASEPVKTSVPMGILSGSVGQDNQMPVERFSPITTGGPNASKLGEIGVLDTEFGKSPTTKKQEPVENHEGNESRVAENPTQQQEHINPGISEAQGKVEAGDDNNDEKAMRQFKIALVEFVKEILKPTWKEGKMSREVHKTVVKKVVDKITTTIQGAQIPRTQAKIDQYLAFSKSKITKLVEAYVERFLKA